MVYHNLNVLFFCSYITLSHYHPADLCESIAYINCLPGLFCGVRIREWVSSLNYLFMQYMGAVFFFQRTHFSRHDCENIYIICVVGRMFLFNRHWYQAMQPEYTI